MNLGKLIAAGYTNTYSEDYGSLAAATRPEFTGYCMSDKCCGYEIVRKGKLLKTRCAKKPKTKVRSETTCPDCKSALHWSKN